MARAVLCPVCGGSGEVIDPYDTIITTSGHQKKPCHGCHGRGWVEVSDY